MTDDETWTVHLTGMASEKFARIVEYTARRFGDAQSLKYQAIVAAAIVELQRGPNVTGAKLRHRARGLYTLHVTRGRGEGRHFLLFRIDQPAVRSIEVLRILYDAMDLEQHFRDESDSRE